MEVKILFVEDVKLKRDEVFEYLEVLNRTTNYNYEIKESSHYQGAAEMLDSYTFDKVILDMTIPDADFSSFENPLNPFGGEDVLFEISCLENPPSILVLTMYESFKMESEVITIESLEKRIKNSFQSLNIEIVHYQTGSQVWKKKLKDFLEG